MSDPVFVFGSNLAGRHGKGAALWARKHRGAIYGRGIGFQGNSYAIPTKDAKLQALALPDIRVGVESFLWEAHHRPDLTFQITPIGCGLAGYRPEQIAPMFRHAPPNVILPPEFVAVLNPDPPASPTGRDTPATTGRVMPPESFTLLSQDHRSGDLGSSREPSHTDGVKLEAALAWRDSVSSLLSWLGQTTPREYVRWLRETQPDVFGDFPEDDATTKLEAVMAAAWSSLAGPTGHTTDRQPSPRDANESSSTVKLEAREP